MPRKPRSRSNGEGSVFQRKDKRWVAVLSVGTKLDGSPDRRCFYGATKGEVLEEMTKAKNELLTTGQLDRKSVV